MIFEKQVGKMFISRKGFITNEELFFVKPNIQKTKKQSFIGIRRKPYKSALVFQNFPSIVSGFLCRTEGYTINI